MPFREALGADLRLKVRDTFESLLQSFAALLKAAAGGSGLEGTQTESVNAPPFESEVARNEYVMRVSGNNIIRAAEHLLALSGRLQRLLVVNDHESLNKHLVERSAVLSEHRATVWRTLAQIRDEMGQHLADLEDEAAR